MTEPWDQRRRDDELTDEERRILDEFREIPVEEQVEPVEERPEVARAVEGDTTVDDEALHGPEERGEPAGEPERGDDASGERPDE